MSRKSFQVRSTHNVTGINVNVTCPDGTKRTMKCTPKNALNATDAQSNNRTLLQSTFASRSAAERNCEPNVGRQREQFRSQNQSYPLQRSNNRRASECLEDQSMRNSSCFCKSGDFCQLFSPSNMNASFGRSQQQNIEDITEPSSLRNDTIPTPLSQQQFAYQPDWQPTRELQKSRRSGANKTHNGYHQMSQPSNISSSTRNPQGNTNSRQSFGQMINDVTAPSLVINDSFQADSRCLDATYANILERFKTLRERMVTSSCQRSTTHHTTSVMNDSEMAYGDIFGESKNGSANGNGSGCCGSGCGSSNCSCGVRCCCGKGTEKITSTKIGGTDRDYVKETFIERSFIMDDGIHTLTKHIITRCDQNGRIEVEVNETKQTSGQADSTRNNLTNERIDNISPPMFPDVSSLREERLSDITQPQMNSTAISAEATPLPRGAENARSALAASPAPVNSTEIDNTNPRASQTLKDRIRRSFSRSSSSKQDSNEESMPAILSSANAPTQKQTPPQMEEETIKDQTTMPTAVDQSNISKARNEDLTEDLNAQTMPSLATTACELPPHRPLQCCPCVCQVCANTIAHSLSLPLDRLDTETLNALVGRRSDEDETTYRALPGAPLATLTPPPARNAPSHGRTMNTTFGRIDDDLCNVSDSSAYSAIEKHCEASLGPLPKTTFRLDDLCNVTTPDQTQNLPVAKECHCNDPPCSQLLAELLIPNDFDCELSMPVECTEELPSPRTDAENVEENCVIAEDSIPEDSGAGAGPIVATANQDVPTESEGASSPLPDVSTNKKSAPSPKKKTRRGSMTSETRSSKSHGSDSGRSSHNGSKIPRVIRMPVPVVICDQPRPPMPCYQQDMCAMPNIYCPSNYYPSPSCPRPACPPQSCPPNSCPPNSCPLPYCRPNDCNRR